MIHSVILTKESDPSFRLYADLESCGAETLDSAQCSGFRVVIHEYGQKLLERDLADGLKITLDR